MTDYEYAKEIGLTNLNRWEEGIEHHPRSVRLMCFLKEHDFYDYQDHFCWKTGGDGDNGEALMYEMDAFFESLDRQEPSALTWTTEPPKVPGWYWFSACKGHAVCILVCADGKAKFAKYHFTDAELLGGKWAGPIPAPPEPEAS